MSADPRLIELFSYYREAELHGAELLLRLLKKLDDDPKGQIKMTLHAADEARHAWLWTKRINELGAKPVPVGRGYQDRIGMRTIPRKVVDLLALTVVVEERSLARYKEHAARPDTDPETLAILNEVTQDEKWHMSWIQEKLASLAAETGDEARAAEMLEKYREIDREVYGELRAMEAEAFGEAS
jgi:bacterioferritin (cytochrome b1)